LPRCSAMAAGVGTPAWAASFACLALWSEKRRARAVAEGLAIPARLGPGRPLMCLEPLRAMPGDLGHEAAHGKPIGAVATCGSLTVGGGANLSPCMAHECQPQGLKRVQVQRPRADHGLIDCEGLTACQRCVTTYGGCQIARGRGTKACCKVGCQDLTYLPC
jgi:hypothetical protein